MLRAKLSTICDHFGGQVMSPSDCNGYWPILQAWWANHTGALDFHQEEIIIRVIRCKIATVLRNAIHIRLTNQLQQQLQIEIQLSDAYCSFHPHPNMRPSLSTTIVHSDPQATMEISLSIKSATGDTTLSRFPRPS